MRGVALVTVVGAMWLIRLVDIVLPGSGSAIGHGIVPRTWAGIAGIPTAPWIHSSVQHLAVNTIPLLILGGLVLLGSVFEFVLVVLTSTFIAAWGRGCSVPATRNTSVRAV